MASDITDPVKSAGVKKYLRRTKSIEELKALADACFGKAVEEVVILNTAAEGGSAGGEVSMPAGILLNAIEEVLAELGEVPLRSDGTMIGRQLGTRPDFSGARFSI
jgi:hypothetical protein